MSTFSICTMPITLNGGGETPQRAQVLDEVVPAFEKLRAGGEDEVPRHYRGRRHRGAAPGHRRGDIRQRAGQLQHAEPVGRGTAAAGLSGAGLWADVRPHPEGGRRRGRHPRARRRGAERGTTQRHPIAQPPPAPIGIGAQLRCRSGAGAAADAAGHGGIRRKPGRRRRRGSPSRIRRWARSWSAWRRLPNSRARWRPCKRVRFRQRLWRGWRNFAPGSRAKAGRHSNGLPGRAQVSSTSSP